MKNIKIFIIVLSVLSLASCEKDFLVKRPMDKLPADGFFNSADRAKLGVNAIYISLASNNMEGNDMIALRLFDPPAGDAVLGAGISGTVFNKFGFSADDPHFMAFYSGCYEGIFRANLVIENVPAIEMDKTLQAQYIGEAKFLRALYYWYLTTMYGEVPLFTKPFNVPEDAFIAKSAIADIYTVMIQDLQDATTVLPVSYGASDLGRATKGAAMSLLGKVYLYAKNYTQAEATFGEVIASGTYELVDNFDNVWNRTSENNKESIFEVQFASALAGATQMVGNSDKHYWPQINGGLGEYVPTQSLVSAFEPADPRLNFSIFNYEGQPFAPQLSTSQVNLDVFKKSWSSTGYAVRKGMVPMVSPLTTSANGTNFPIIRFADVLLMYAEAANEVNKIDEARNAVNRVRQRPSVNMPILTTANTGTKQLMFDAIVHERRIELAFEQHRFNDLRRWGLAATELAYLGYSEDRNRYFPLPQLEIDINSNLVQLSGW